MGLYPTAASQLELISECAMKAGFVFSMIVDYPNSSKAKKYYILLDSGSVKRVLPKALTTTESHTEKQLYRHPNDDAKDSETKHNDAEQIRMQSGKDPIELQAMREHFVHGDKKKSKHLKFASRKRGVDRFQDRDWVIQQKQRRAARGHKNVPADSKYTARKRKPRF